MKEATVQELKRILNTGPPEERLTAAVRPHEVGEKKHAVKALKEMMNRYKH